MLEPDERLSEALLDATVLDVVPVQMIDPELRRSLGNRIGRGRNLTGSRASLHAIVGKGGVYRAGLGIGVGVVKMVVGVAAVKKNGLLDQPLAEHLRQEVHVFLSAARTDGDMVHACYQRHNPILP